jgi:hypothetical protein
LDAFGASLENGAGFIQFTRNGGDNQQFIVEPAANGYYKIIVKHSGKALDIYSASQNNGAGAVQWDFHGGDNQLWSIEQVEAGYYKIVAKHSNKALEIYGSSQDNASPVLQWDYHGGDNQKWKFEEISTFEPTHVRTPERHRQFQKTTKLQMHLSSYKPELSPRHK